MGIKVRSEMRGRDEGKEELYSRWYADAESLHMYEQHDTEYESDFVNGSERRESFDNGKTWSEYRDVYKDQLTAVGDKDEIGYYDFEPNIPDPSSGNSVTCGLMRYFINGHIEAYRREWGEGENDARDHSYLIYRRPDGTVSKQLLKYEDGADYDPDDPRSADYLDNNISYFGKIGFASNGDLLIPVGAAVRSCCRILGLDVNEVFPSCPKIMCGMILFRARWLPDEGKYELSHSKPVVISDLLSSRGVCEPCVCELPSGRIAVVFRGSNVQSPNWHTRIAPNTPGFKWFTVSDDGGASFSQVMPWFFDTKEAVYSSATLSYFFRSSKTGKTYWIGNITDPKTTYGNFPRWPLYICQVDDKYGYLLKETLTEIDTRREGESDEVQLSNFQLLENRETKELEVRLCKLGILKGRPWDLTETWTYYISFD